MAKRLWALAVSLDDKEVLEKLYPLFSSEASICYQINAEIETLSLMFEKWDILGDQLIKDGAYTDMVNQIDEFKMRLSMVYDLTLDDEQLQYLVDSASQTNPSTLSGRKKIIKTLDMIVNHLQIAINRYSEQYLKKVGLLDPTYYDHLLK